MSGNARTKPTVPSQAALLESVVDQPALGDRPESRPRRWRRGSRTSRACSSDDAAGRVSPLFVHDTDLQLGPRCVYFSLIKYFAGNLAHSCRAEREPGAARTKA